MVQRGNPHRSYSRTHIHTNPQTPHINIHAQIHMDTYKHKCRYTYVYKMAIGINIITLMQKNACRDIQHTTHIKQSHRHTDIHRRAHAHRHTKTNIETQIRTPK